MKTIRVDLNKDKDITPILEGIFAGCVIVLSFLGIIAIVYSILTLR